MLRRKMSSWFSFWRVQTKFDDCTGPFAVGCTDFMCAKDDSAGVTSDAGSFIRFLYPTEKTAAASDESKTCYWIPRQEYTSGLVNFIKMPVWLLGRMFHWTVGGYHCIGGGGGRDYLSQFLLSMCRCMVSQNPNSL